jgi:hypothetical protein
VNPGEITRRLSAGNVWWADPRGWARKDPDLRRLRERALPYAPKPLSDLADGGLYVLYGARRVGKSVVVKRRIEKLIGDGVQPRRIVHFACDELDRGDLQRLVTQARDVLTRTVEEPRIWFLDEITSVQDWPRAIKWLRDNTAFDDDTVVLTGSSAAGLEAARKELADRRGPVADSDRILRPMSFRSFCACMQSSAPLDAPVVDPAQFQPDAEAVLDELVPWLDELAGLWDVFLMCGGLPRAVADQVATGNVGRDFVNGLWDVIVGDAFKSSRLTAGQAEGLLRRMVLNTASLTNLTKVAGDMGVASHHTAAARINDLIAAQLAWPCHRIGARSAPDLAAQSKFYFADPLLSRLLHLRNPSMPEPSASQLSEQQIGMELLRAVELPAASSAEYSRIMYRRTKTKEVDFVGPAFPGQGFEGKFVDAKWRQESQTVRSQFGRGILATRTVYDIGGVVWAVPACMLAYLLNPSEAS